MSGTAKWLVVGSVVVIALTALITLALFSWMMFGGMMSGRNAIWGSFGGGNGFPGMGSMMGNSGRAGYGMLGHSGFGMMGGRGYGAPLSGESMVGEDFTVALVENLLAEYLGERDDLEIGEVMIFDNHAYAQIIETESGIGAMEVLVDPVSLSITPEHGPNMMWNLKYGGMHGGGMMGNSGGGMMGSTFTGTDPDEMTVSPAEAVAFADEYLQQFAAEMTADDHAVAFYGYYTIHTLRDGEIEGMLSVNGYSGQVFPHTWHGELLALSDTGHD